MPARERNDEIFVRYDEISISRRTLDRSYRSAHVRYRLKLPIGSGSSRRGMEGLSGDRNLTRACPEAIPIDHRVGSTRLS